VALSDESSSLARPLTVLDQTGKELREGIRNIAKAHDVETIVVGFPDPLRTDENERTRPVERFIRTILEPLDRPLVRVSERYTTKQATRLRRERGQSGEASDAEAAALILQRYLDEGDASAGESADDR
jgi:putative transcription antitermination factor YqgF